MKNLKWKIAVEEVKEILAIMENELMCIGTDYTYITIQNMQKIRKCFDYLQKKLEGKNEKENKQ